MKAEEADRGAVQPVPCMSQGERGKSGPLSGVALVKPFMELLQLLFIYPLGDHVLGETLEFCLYCWATLSGCEALQEEGMENGVLLVSFAARLLLVLPFLEGEEDGLG